MLERIVRMHEEEFLTFREIADALSLDEEYVACLYFAGTSSRPIPTN